jgi:hypothetical protein
MLSAKVLSVWENRKFLQFSCVMITTIPITAMGAEHIWMGWNMLVCCSWPRSGSTLPLLVTLSQSEQLVNISFFCTLRKSTMNTLVTLTAGYRHDTAALKIICCVQMVQPTEKMFKNHQNRRCVVGGHQHRSTMKMLSASTIVTSDQCMTIKDSKWNCHHVI